MLAAMLGGLVVLATRWTATTPNRVPQPAAQIAAAPEPTLPPKGESFGYTVFRDRRLWEQAITGRMQIEDFEHDSEGNDPLAFPYETSNQFVVNGYSVASIRTDAALLPTGKLFHLYDSQIGSTLHFPHETSVNAFGFDYHAEQPWTLVFNEPARHDESLDLPPEEKAFIGIVFNDGDIEWLRFASNTDKSEMAIDNISFVNVTHATSK